MESEPILIKEKVLFLCYHNSARSQMAEGLLRSMHGDRYDVYSAGVEATYVDPRAIQVMKEIGIDITSQRSKKVDEFNGILFDLAVTVCDKAQDACPICGVSVKAPVTAPAAKKTIQKTFRDPVVSVESEEAHLAVFRQVRDEIKAWIINTFGG